MTPRPYAVMVHPAYGVHLAYEPMLTRASMEAEGFAFVADFPGWNPAADRAAATAALPDVERLAVARIRWNDMSTTNSPAALWDALIEVQGSEAAWRAINGEVG